MCKYFDRVVQGATEAQRKGPDSYLTWKVRAGHKVCLPEHPRELCGFVWSPVNRAVDG